MGHHMDRETEAVTVRHTLFCRSMWQETQGTTAQQTGLFLCQNQVLNTGVPLASVGPHVAEYTHTSAPLYSGRFSPLGFWKPLEGEEEPLTLVNSARELRPASSTSRAPGHPGGSGVAARSSGGDVSMALEPGNASSQVLCGAGRGEARAEGTSQAGRRLSQRACSPPPFPRTGLASLRHKRGAGTMGVLCPGEALKDPRLTS